MNNPLFGPDANPTMMYVLGIAGMICTAVWMSICFIATRVMRDLHYSVVQFNYALVNTVSVGIILLGQIAWNQFKEGPVRWPFVYDSWQAYLELFASSVCNMVG